MCDSIYGRIYSLFRTTLTPNDMSIIKSPEELFKEIYGDPGDKWDRSSKKYDYHDMIAFADRLGEYYGFQTKIPKD